MKTKAIFLLLLLVLSLVSIYKGEIFTRLFVVPSNYVVGIYDSTTTAIKDFVTEHFAQANEIKALREQNIELKRSATLLSTFATQLNQILSDKNSMAYEPDVKLVRTLGYANIGDYNKIWVDSFDEFNPEKIYGLIYNGKSIGILTSKNDRPLAILQNDPKSVFSVYIGETKAPGVASGSKSAIMVKFIPKWINIKVGDEVFTSGLDGIFFGGVPVGKVVEIFDESLYQSALIKPYESANTPSYLYVVTKER